MYIRFNGVPWCDVGGGIALQYDEARDASGGRLASVHCGVSAEQAPRFVADLLEVFPNAKVEAVDEYCPSSAAFQEDQAQRYLDEDPVYQRRRRDDRIAQAEELLRNAERALCEWTPPSFRAGLIEKIGQFLKSQW